MEQSLKKYCILSVLFVLCGCRFLGPYHYETYAPVKKSLSFINDSVCVYTRYSISNKDSIVLRDTCLWKHPSIGFINLYKNKDHRNITMCMEDTCLNFEYNVCPKWHSIEEWEFERNKSYRYSLYKPKTPVSRPLGDRRKYSPPTLEDIYGNSRIMYDTIVNYGPYMLWFSKRSRHPMLLFANGKQLKEESPIVKKARNSLHELFTNSYEYINYKVNHEKIVDFASDSIVGKLFSFIGDSCKKESIRFINDSICLYEASKIDTCQYVVKNNLIAIDVIKYKSCDTLAYSNGILFYSKVYKDNKTDKYEHIVKPFIDEARSCASKTDSINMIMNAYYSVYVPLNMYK